MAVVGKGICGLGRWWGIGSSKIAQIGAGALRGTSASLATQGIAAASGLQDSFSWAGVAAAGIAAGVGEWLGGGFQPLAGANLSPGNIAAHTAVGAASLIASAATRSAIEGSSFGRNVMAGLPDVIGQTLGRALVGRLRRPALSENMETNFNRRRAGAEAHYQQTVEWAREDAERISDPGERQEALDAIEIFEAQGPDLNAAFRAAVSDTAAARGLSPNATVSSVVDVSDRRYSDYLRSSPSAAERADAGNVFENMDIIIVSADPGVSADSTIGRVVVDAAVYGQEKVEGINPVLRRGVEFTVRAVLTGGTSALIDQAVQTAAPPVIESLPDAIVRPIAEAGASLNRFVGDTGGSYLLDRDISRDGGQGARRDSGGVSWATWLVAGSAVTVVTGLARRWLNRGGASFSDFPSLNRISDQKQARHIIGTPEYQRRGGGSYFVDADGPQHVLDAWQNRDLEIVGRHRDGGPVVRVRGVEGAYNHNPGSGYPNQETDVFWIKGRNDVSVVPMSPAWRPR
jgi:hypothetical protein